MQPFGLPWHDSPVVIFTRVFDRMTLTSDVGQEWLLDSDFHGQSSREIVHTSEYLIGMTVIQPYLRLHGVRSRSRRVCETCILLASASDIPSRQA